METPYLIYNEKRKIFAKLVLKMEGFNLLFYEGSKKKSHMALLIWFIFWLKWILIGSKTLGFPRPRGFEPRG